jgi:hypothetical protein
MAKASGSERLLGSALINISPFSYRFSSFLAGILADWTSARSTLQTPATAITGVNPIEVTLTELPSSYELNFSKAEDRYIILRTAIPPD